MKVKPIWILLKQETVSGSGISWAICQFAPRSRQITTPVPHHSVFYRPDALPAAQSTTSKHWRHTLWLFMVSWLHHGWKFVWWFWRWLWLYGCSEVNQLKGVGKSTSSLSHGASPLLKTRLSSSHPDLSSLQLLQPPDHRPGDFPEHCLKVFRADHACRYLLIHKVCPHPATRHSPVSVPPFSAFTNCLFMPLWFACTVATL